MTRIFLLLAVLAMSALAQAELSADAHYRFVPSAGAESRCQHAGFIGTFSFHRDKEYPDRIANLIFAKTAAKMVVFHDRGSVWRMSVMGPWSETSVVDFDKGFLRYDHSEVGRSRSCEGTFRPAPAPFLDLDGE